jgi:UDP-N-acetyl-D-galactosamine dehydrogenase
MSAPSRPDSSLGAESIVAIVGLGYVGLPLVVAFGRQFTTIGYDRSDAKIAACQRGEDPTGEVATETLSGASKLTFTDDQALLLSSRQYRRQMEH